MKILFVCLGNICRSPLAEALFDHKIREKGVENKFEIASAGTADYHVGESPDARTIRNALKNGIKINHVGRQVKAEDLKYFDLILPMDQSNLGNIMRLHNASLYADKIKLMREFDPVKGRKDVPDPWSGGEKDFQEVFEILDRSTAALLAHLEVKK